MPGWGERRIRDACIADIERDVVGQHLVAEDITDVLAVVAGEENCVVRQVVNLYIGSSRENFM